MESQDKPYRVIDKKEAVAGDFVYMDGRLERVVAVEAKQGRWFKTTSGREYNEYQVGSCQRQVQ